MKEHDIDKLFKSKTAQGNFSYTPSYWQDAEKLIAQTSTKKDKTGIWVFSIAALLLTATAAIILWQNKSHQAQHPELNLTEQPVFIQGGNTVTNTKNEIPPALNNNDASSKATDSEPIAPRNTHATETHTKPSTPQNTIPKNTPAATKHTTKHHPTKQNIAANNVVSETKPTSASGDVSPKNSERVLGSQQTISSSETKPKNSMQPGLQTQPMQKPESNEIFETATLATSAQTQPKQNSAPTENSNTAKIKDEQTEEKTNSVADIPPDYAAANKVNKQRNFTLDAGPSFGYFNLKRNLASSNAAYEAFRNKHEAALNATQLGVHVGVGYKNWLLTSGIFQTKITEDVNYPTEVSLKQVENNSHWDYYDVWSYTTQSSWVIDSIYQGHWHTDTVWSVYEDSTFINQFDTIYTTAEDPELAKNNGKRTATYIEVPILLGRSFLFNKFRIDAQAGISIGFYTAYNGASYIGFEPSLATSLQDPSSLQYTKVLYHFLLRAGIRYQFSQQLATGIYPTLRYQLNNTFNTQNLNQTYIGVGFNIGVFYQF